MDNKKQIFINSTIGSSRAATVENSVLTDLYIDFPDHKKMVGNIYKGKVQNVIPGMQAAFVDIGYHINAFLPFTEISQLSKLNDIDLCHYDSDKSYNGKMWSLPRLWKHLRPGGILVCDDASDNLAFKDFSELINVKPIIIDAYDTKVFKHVGVLIKP